MAYSDPLADKVRTGLTHLPNVEEKKMFGGLAFMISGKMCLTVGSDRIMCRIDPAIHEKAIKRPGCRTVVMRGRPLKGYVYVHEDRLQSKTALNDWIGLALDFNKKIQGT